MRLTAVLMLLGARSCAGAASVQLPFGEVRGTALQHAREFLGIPYAPQPPRFGPPDEWTAKYAGGTLQATEYTPQCWQTPDPFTPSVSGMSEDCLHLNVYTPVGANASSLLPVMVWIHGGALQTGSAMLPAYNASALAAQQDLVVVAINYRLNVFGFSSVDGGTTNAGFRDQRVALRWVRAHAAAFGGDAARVTIFGESAGGQSVGMHVLTAGSAGLFDAAIAESGDITALVPLERSRNETAQGGVAVGCPVGADQLACLRKLAPADLLKAPYSTSPFSSVMDGDVYAAMPLDLIRAGAFNKVPFMFGNNDNEGNLFVFPPSMNSTPATAEQVRCAFRYAAGPAAEQLLEVYAPVDAEGIDNRHLIGDAFTDSLFHCGNRRVARELARAGHAPWVFSWKHQPAPGCMGVPVPGAIHASEIAYVFAMYGLKAGDACQQLYKGLVPPPPVPAEDVALAAKVSSMWADFARAHRPDAAWPRYTLPEEPVLKLGLSTLSALDTETGYSRVRCDAIDASGLADADAGNIIGSFGACQQMGQR